jgi:hypothetical protein
MKDWVHGRGMPYPEKLIDITTVPELVGIKIANERSARSGAATTLTSMAESDDLKKVASVHRRSRCVAAHSQLWDAGGNINQRHACWFLRGENFACYKRGDFCFAVTGDNRYPRSSAASCATSFTRPTRDTLLALTRRRRWRTRKRLAVLFDNYFTSPRRCSPRERLKGG